MVKKATKIINNDKYIIYWVGGIFLVLLIVFAILYFTGVFTSSKTPSTIPYNGGDSPDDGDFAPDDGISPDEKDYFPPPTNPPTKPPTNNKCLVTFMKATNINESWDDKNSGGWHNIVTGMPEKTDGYYPLGSCMRTGDIYDGKPEGLDICKNIDNVKGPYLAKGDIMPVNRFIWKYDNKGMGTDVKNVAVYQAECPDGYKAIGDYVRKLGPISPDGKGNYDDPNPKDVEMYCLPEECLEEYSIISNGTEIDKNFWTDQNTGGQMDIGLWRTPDNTLYYTKDGKQNTNPFFSKKTYRIKKEYLENV